jgi:hypothetical protein
MLYDLGVMAVGAAAVYLAVLLFRRVRQGRS